MKKALDILLIEDDIDDVDLLKEALLENNVHYKMQVIMEGDKVFNYLQTIETLPEIIVMDLNLPKTDGKEILQEIKSTFSLTQIPIVVLTTSSSKEDIDYCNKMGISKFITKPATIEGWNSTIHAIVHVANASLKQEQDLN
ncbi:MAG: response regulator [Segetibacter sp.]|nr:response regulator [Segetibacter sp.]